MSDGKQDGATEQFIGWTILFGMFLAIIYAYYYFNSEALLNVLRWVRYGEVWLIAALTPDSFSITAPDGKDININQLLNTIKTFPSEDLSPQLMSYVSFIALFVYKWVGIILISCIGFWTYTKGPGTQYTEIFNLDGFIKFQAKSLPIISPFINFNPSKQPPRPPGSDVPAELPIFAEALGPEEWLAYYQIPVKDQKVDKNAVFNAFKKQLGPRWKGAKALAPYKQVLLAGFCLKSARKRDESDEMMGRLAKCWDHKEGLKLNKDPSLLKEARKILANKELSYDVLKKCNQHAWQTTALLRGLLCARENGGVLAPAQFVWLRAHDRELWYPLNNLGRQSHHAEAIGAMSHFKTEKRAQRPIPKAKVQDAVTSVTDYMSSGNARPIPKLDYSQSKNKRGIKKIKDAKA